jgi:hypothetical protein
LAVDKSITVGRVVLDCDRNALSNRALESSPFEGLSKADGVKRSSHFIPHFRLFLYPAFLMKDRGKTLKDEQAKRMCADDRQLKPCVFFPINLLQQRPLTYRPLETSSSVSIFPGDSRESYRTV